MTADEFLQHRAAVVRHRRCGYGNPAALLERVAARWSQVLCARVTAQQVGLCLRDLTLARLAHDPGHVDSLVDIAGYAACLAEVRR